MTIEKQKMTRGGITKLGRMCLKHSILLMKIHSDNPNNYFHSFDLSYKIQIISVHHLHVRSIDMISRQCIPPMKGKSLTYHKHIRGESRKNCLEYVIS